MAAAVAAGEFADLKTAAAAMVHVKGRIEPDPAAFAAYRRKFEVHRAVSAALESSWERFGKS